MKRLFSLIFVPTISFSWWSVITGEKGGLVLNVIDCGLVVSYIRSSK